MWMARRHPERDHLGDYWNALNRGAPPEELARLAAPLDPTLLAAIDRARALHRRRRPDPVFASQLEQTIMNALAAAPAGTVPLGPTRSDQLNGRTDVLSPPWQRPRFALPRPGALLAQLVTVMLIVATIGGIFLIANNANNPAVVPPVQTTATPEATLPADVPMVRVNPARTGEHPGPGPTGLPGEVWRFTAQGAVGSAVIVAGGLAYVGSDDGALHALDFATGEERWQFATGAGRSPIPAVAGETLFVAGADGMIHALDAATGAERWASDPALPLSHQYVLGGDTIYIGGTDNLFYALSSADGTERWRFRLDGSPITSQPSLADGIVYVGSDDGNLYAIDTATGSERWRVATGFVLGIGSTVGDGAVYITARTADSRLGQLIAVDAASGQPRWRASTPSGAPLTGGAPVGGLVYAGGFDNNLYAFDAATGAQRWVFATGNAASIETGPAVADGVVYASSIDNHVYAVDAASGSERWRLLLDGQINTAPTITGGVVYIGTRAGSVYALGDGGTALAPAPAASAETDATASPAITSSATPAATVASNPVEFVWQATGGPEPLANTFWVAVAPDGTVWANDAGQGQFQIFDQDGQYLETWAPPGVPAASELLVAFGPGGEIYVLDGVFVRKYDRDRNLVTTWGSRGAGDGQLENATGIGVDAQGNLMKVDAEGNSYLVDNSGDSVHKFSPDGTFLLSFGDETGDGHLVSPNDVAIDADGNVYVAEYGSGRVVVFDATGRFLTAWGTFGAEEGQLLSADGIALDGAGGVYVADSFGARVVKFRLLPPLAPDTATPAA